ncbi:CBS domain-containing protein [Anaeromyxobacter oryzae]|uniref:CBS domain-containing protein n=1 Tax=Anaeromyxobacter oryzae TaxID=2918170 RepID=A0ABM7WRY8_9BACT|nr:CBS domain-containing protein [Anaeromyxobacter oryzae]BDG02206.1 hypothetical protein AMOR_12020 [Anaeromyxobacter oryzae]
MRVDEIMSRAVRTATAGESAELAYERMRAGGIRHLVVVEGGRVVGIVSERDLGGARGAAIRSGRTVGELMTEGVATATPATTLRQAANLLRGRTIGCLPVLDETRLVGIVTVTDLLEVVGDVARKASTDARWKPVRRMGRWPRVSEDRRARR